MFRALIYDVYKSQNLQKDLIIIPVDYDPIHFNIITYSFNFVRQPKENRVYLPCLDKYDNANCSDGSMNCPDVKKSESK